MNYLIPVNNLQKDIDKIIDINKEGIENIITQQLVISQLSNGISYQDTENMDEYERVFVYKKLIEMKKEELEAREKAMKNIGKG